MFYLFFIFCNCYQLSLKGNQIGDDGATCLLFHAWTKRELLEDFEEKLKPAHALPFEKVCQGSKRSR
jgi:hypothetical protein